MQKLIIASLLLVGLNAFAVKWAPISGSCDIKGQSLQFSFPNGNGSLFPVYTDGTILSIYAGPSENLVVDEKGTNLIDLNIMANDLKGNGMGSVIIRHLTAKSALAREVSLELSNGNSVNCKF